MRNAFTLIELIIVIVLLGILSAIAMPKYFDLTEDAHKARVQGTQSALHAGIDLMHAKYLISKDKQGIARWGPSVEQREEHAIDPTAHLPVESYPVPQGHDDCVTLWTATMSVSSATPQKDEAPGIFLIPNDFYYTFGGMGCIYYYTGTLAQGDEIKDATWHIIYLDNGKVDLVEGPLEH